MSKRRKKESRFKQFKTNPESYSDNEEDYTADFESYDFVNDESSNELVHKMKADYHNSLDIKNENSENINDEEINLDNICRDYQRSICKRGRKCKYKHPLLQKRQWNNVTNENSPKSASIQFEVNFCHDFQNNGCNRPQCRFIHCSRSEQEFYYATGILLPSVPHNNFQVPFCKDFLNNSCNRVKCKYLHLTKEELDQHQAKTLQSNINSTINGVTTNQVSTVTQPEYISKYNNIQHQPTNIDQSIHQAIPPPTTTYYPNYISTNSINHHPSLTNPTQFTVSLPLGSVSYSTSQQQLIAQPTLTNVQLIHEPPILSSLNTSPPEMSVGAAQPSSSCAAVPVSVCSNSINHNMSNVQATRQPQVAPQPQQQQVVYSGIIHNPHAQHHHTHPHHMQPQFTIISSDNNPPIPLPIVAGNTTNDASMATVTAAHILNHPAVAVAHPVSHPHHYHPHHHPHSISTTPQLTSINQPITQPQQPSAISQTPMGMSLISVATPCSFISASPTTAEVVHTFQQQQQLRSYDQKDGTTCVVQRKTIPNTHNIELTVSDNNNTNNLTPIYIHHQSLSSMPITQYRVTAMETATTTPSIVIHNNGNNMDTGNANLESLLTNSTIGQSESLSSVITSMTNNIAFNHTQMSPSFTVDKFDHYSKIIQENEHLKRKLHDLEKQANDLHTANELLLDQNARLRNMKSVCCNSESLNNSNLDESNSLILNVNSSQAKKNITNANNNNNNHSVAFNRINHHRHTPTSFLNQNNLHNKNVNDCNINSLVSNNSNNNSNSHVNNNSEMATITLTVPLSKTHNNHDSSIDIDSSSLLSTSLSTSLSSITTNKFTQNISPIKTNNLLSSDSITLTSLTSTSTSNIPSSVGISDRLGEGTSVDDTKLTNNTTMNNNNNKNQQEQHTRLHYYHHHLHQNPNSVTTSQCSDYLSPTLVNSAIHSIQKSVMPTLQALMASSSNNNSNTENRKSRSQIIMKDGLDQNVSEFQDNCQRNVKPSCTESANDVDVPIRSSSCPVSSYSFNKASVISSTSTEANEGVNSNKCYYNNNNNLSINSFNNHTPQLCLL